MAHFMQQDSVKGEHMRKQLTAEQIERRDARRAQFRALVKTVANLPELQRVQIANKFGLRTVEGHELSLCNTMLVYMQNPHASMVGGFKQWIKAGRAVIKGQHGMMIWVPIGHKPDGDASPVATGKLMTDQAESPDDTRFIIGTVFDISQTQEIETQVSGNLADIEQPTTQAVELQTV